MLALVEKKASYTSVLIMSTNGSSLGFQFVRSTIVGSSSGGES